MEVSSTGNISGIESTADATELIQNLINLDIAQREVKTPLFGRSRGYQAKYQFVRNREFIKYTI